MNISDLSRPVTAKALNESLAKQFGEKINLEAFSLEQLQNARNNLRTNLSQVETTESYNAVQSEKYTKNKLFLDVLNAEVAERESIELAAIKEGVLREGAEDAAELVMAAKDMVDRVTGWMEDTAEMQTDSMLDLADAIRDEQGSEASEAFVNTVKPALEALYDVMETTRAALTSGVGQLTGEEEAVDTMGTDDMDMEPLDGEDDMEMDAEEPDMEMDDFEADAAAAGGEAEAGREKRESVERSKKKLK